MLNYLPDYAFVIARGPAKNPHYRAVKLDQQTGYMRPLVYDGEDPVNFECYAEASRVCLAYNEGPDEDARAARWLNGKDDWGWEVTETRSARMSWKNEDFHSDDGL